MMDSDGPRFVSTTPCVRAYTIKKRPVSRDARKIPAMLSYTMLCWDRADHPWQSGVKSKPACRPRGRAARSGCQLYFDMHKPTRLI